MRDHRKASLVPLGLAIVPCAALVLGAVTHPDDCVWSEIYWRCACRRTMTVRWHTSSKRQNNVCLDLLVTVVCYFSAFSHRGLQMYVLPFLFWVRFCYPFSTVYK